MIIKHPFPFLIVEPSLQVTNLRN